MAQAGLPQQGAAAPASASHVKKISCLVRWMPAPTTSPGLQPMKPSAASRCHKAGDTHWGVPTQRSPAWAARAAQGGAAGHRSGGWRWRDAAAAGRTSQDLPRQLTQRPGHTPPPARAGCCGACAPCLLGSHSCGARTCKAVRRGASVGAARQRTRGCRTGPRPRQPAAACGAVRTCTSPFPRRRPQRVRGGGSKAWGGSCGAAQRGSVRCGCLPSPGVPPLLEAAV